MPSPTGMQIYDPQGHRLYLTGSERAAFRTAAEAAPREVRTYCWTFGRTEQRYVKFHRLPDQRYTSTRGLSPWAWRGLQFTRVDKVLERSGRDLDDPCNGGFGDMLAQEQLDFLLLAIEFGLP